MYLFFVINVVFIRIVASLENCIALFFYARVFRVVLTYEILLIE